VTARGDSMFDSLSFTLSARTSRDISGDRSSEYMVAE
jgi:hypothetical protein